MQSTIRPSTPYLSHRPCYPFRTVASVCTVRTLAQPFFHKKAFSVVPNCTQHPHRRSPDKNSFEQRSFSQSLRHFCPISSKRESCTCSTDRAPWHGDHDVRSHGLDQRNGAVDGLGPAKILLVTFGEVEYKKTYPDTLQLCSRLALRSSRSGNCHRWWTSFNAPIWTNPVGKNVSKKSIELKDRKSGTHKLRHLP